MKKGILRSTFIVLLCSVFSKLLSYIWEASLAANLGANDNADCFYMMLSIFNILYPILDLGIWKVFMPIYKTKLTRNEVDSANKVANISIAFFFVLSIVLVITLIAFARPLTVLIAPGFSEDNKQMTAQFIRMASPLYLTMAVSSVLGAILQSHGKFFGSQLREIGAHVSKILFLALCFRFFGIYAAVLAYIVGSVFRVLVQIPFIDWDWKYKIDFHFRDREILKMMRGLPSVAITAAVSHINSLIDKIFASNAVTGAVACLNYGNKLMNVFSGMVSMAVSTATYPTIIQYAAEKQDDKLKELIDVTINTLSYIIIPISVYCVFFSKDIVIAAFQRGAFDSTATNLTSQIFIGYSIGMLFIGLQTTISNVYYAFGDAKITMYITILGIAMNIVLNFFFFHYFEVAGLAFATSTSAIICHFIRLFVLKRFVRLDFIQLLTETLKVLFVSIASIGFTFFLFSNWIRINKYLYILLSAFLSMIFFISLSTVFHIRTQRIAFSLFKRKFSKMFENKRNT